jgi:peptide/nickel transport system substrate-binding protein
MKYAWILSICIVALLLSSTVLRISADITYGGTVTVAFFWSLSTNPIAGWTYCLYHLAYDTLAKLDANYNRALWVAESIERPDMSTWTVRIHNNVTFHDGTPLTSEDVKFSLETAMVVGGSLGRYVSGIKSVEIIDNRTLSVKSEAPTLQDAWIDTVFLIPKHYWVENNATGVKALTFKNVPMIGTGPWNLTEYKAGNYMLFTANANYWRGRVYPDKLLIQAYTNMDAAIAALKRGEVDIVNNVPISVLTGMEGYPNIATSAISSPDTRGMMINITPPPNGTGNPTLLDKQVRMAMQLAINKTYLNQFNWGGKATQALSVVSPLFTKYYNKEYEAQMPQFNLTKANETLTNAGYTIRDGSGIRSNANGTKLDYQLIVSTGRPDDGIVAGVIQGWFKQIGINIRPQVMEAAAKTSLENTCKFDLALDSWSVVDVSANFYLYTSAAIGFGSDVPLDPVFDALYREQLFETNDTKRVQLLKNMQQYMIENTFEIDFVYDFRTAAYRSDKVGGIAEQPGGIFGKNAPRTTLTMYTIAPSETDQGQGLEPWVVPVVVGVIVIAIGVLAGLLFMRKRKRS